MRPIPSRIVLCGHPFEVQVIDLSEGDIWGRISHDDGMIKISNKLSLLRQWEVLGHEIMHAFLERADLNGPAPVPLNAEQIGNFIGYQLGELLSRESLEAQP